MLEITAEETDQFFYILIPKPPRNHELIISGDGPGMVLMQPLQHLSVNWYLGTSNIRVYFNENFQLCQTGVCLHVDQVTEPFQNILEKSYWLWKCGALIFLRCMDKPGLQRMSDSHGHPKGSGQGGLTHKKGSHQARESFGRVGKTRRQTGKVKWEEPLKCLGFWGSGVCGTETDGVIQWRRALLETLDGRQ